jgi:hypothetical protein
MPNVSWPVYEVIPSQPAPPGVYRAFPSLNVVDNNPDPENGVGLEPPDGTICVGNRFVLTAVNAKLAVYRQNGQVVVQPTLLTEFFRAPGVKRRRLRRPSLFV